MDTINANMTTANKRNGTFNLCYGSRFVRDCQIRIVTTNGAVAVSPSEVTISTNDKRAAPQDKIFRFPPGSGVRKEVAAFAESIYTGEPNPRGSPEEAYFDLKLLQGMLESGEEDGMTMKM